MLTINKSFTSSYIEDIKIKSIEFAKLFYAHVKTHFFAYLMAWFTWILFSNNYVFAFNETASLPQRLFIVQMNKPVLKGDYLAFHVPPEASKHFKNPNATLTKIVVGTEGDRVTVKDRVVYVNDTPVGYAKEKSLKGEILNPISSLVIPHGMYYVMGLHKDSLDSRYTIVGLVPSESIVGRAYPIF
jgi:conjugal transfer pilin signal peptidase TrbI